MHLFLRIMYASTLCAALLPLSLHSLAAQTQPFPRDGERRIYIAPDDHTDYFWTADDAQYSHAFIQTLDYYLRLADSTDHLAPEFQSRWNCDGWMWLWEYEKNMPEARFLSVIDRVRSGHISSPLNALVSCYGGVPAEAVLRGMYYPGTLERRFGLRFPMVVAMENQTLPLGLASLWSGAGATFSWRGVCGCSSKVPDLERREHELYWYTGLDGGRLLMKWQSMTGGNASVGGYAEARDPYAAVDVADAFCETPGYPWRIAGMFGAGWDDFTTMTPSFIHAAQDRTRAGRRVIVSNEEDFFHDVLATHGDAFPSETRSYGSEWDLLCASMPETSASIKRALATIRSAEAMAVLLQPYRNIVGELREQRDEAWRGLGLYWEHDWTADGHFSRSVRAQWQRDIAALVTGYANRLLDSTRTELARRIRTEHTAQRFYIFNPLGWTRSDAADIDLPAPIAGDIHVVDVATGRELPSQRFQQDGRHILRVYAEAVPALGYRCYEVRTGAGSAFDPAASYDQGIISNARLSVAITERGGIRSFIDHTIGGRNWIDASTGAANDLGGSTGTVTLEYAGPVSLCVRVHCSEPFERDTRITVYRAGGRVDIDNNVTSGLDGMPLWDFPFAVSKPVVHHEEVGAVLRAAYEPTGHYARRNARYDWLTLNHFADVSGTEGGITLSNADAYFMKLGASTVQALDTASARLRVLLGGQVDGTHLGIHWDDGDTEVRQRFALHAHGGYDPARALRFAIEHQHPFVTAFLQNGSDLPDTEYRLLNELDSSLILWALKPAEDDPAQRVLARIWNLSDRSAAFSLSAAQGGMSAIQLTSHIETPIAALAGSRISDTLRPQQMRSYIFQLDHASTFTGRVPSATPSLHIGYPYPTPAQAGQDVTLPYSASGGGVYWELRDLLGRRLLTGRSDVADRGYGRIILPSHALLPGVYQVSVKSGSEHARRVVVLR